MQWVYDPHRGGVTIPERTEERTGNGFLRMLNSSIVENMCELRYGPHTVL